MHEIPFQKIHDLLALLELCIPVFPELELEKELLAYLSQFAVNYRYPGEFASKTFSKVNGKVKRYFQKSHQMKQIPS